MAVVIESLFSRPQLDRQGDYYAVGTRKCLRPLIVLLIRGLLR